MTDETEDDLPTGNGVDVAAGTPGDVLTLRYRALRAHIGELEKKHKADIAKWKTAMADIEGKMTAMLQQTGARHIGTPNGTFYLSTRYTASIKDKDEFRGFVIENRMWSMLDWKCNATEARAYAKEHKELPPGVNLTATQTIGVTAPR